MDSKSEVILDEKLFGDHFKKKFLRVFYFKSPGAIA